MEFGLDKMTLAARRPPPGAALEERQRAAAVAEALTWLGTPFRDCADRKGVGVDCAMMLVRVFVDTGIIPAFDPRPYAPQWFQHRSEEKFLGFVGRFGIEVERAPVPGDVIVYRFGRCFAHGAIVVDGENVVHAYKRLGAVVMSPLRDAGLALLKTGSPRPRKIFDVWARR